MSLFFLFFEREYLLSKYTSAIAFSSSADAANAISRLYGVFEAELLTDKFIQDENLVDAVEVKGAAFTWDVPPDKSSTDSKSGSKKGKPEPNKLKLELEAARKAKESAEKAKNDEESVFKLKDIYFSIPRGQLVAIVGAVGSGKTSLLQGIIGEMRRTSGSIKFGGSVAYCSQSAWIQVIIFLFLAFVFVACLCNAVTLLSNRMRQFAKIFVLVAHSMKKSTGVPFMTRALNPILIYYLTVTSRK